MLQEDVTLGMGAVQAPGGIICKFGAGAGMAWLDRSVADAPSLPMRRVRCPPNHGRPFSGTSRRTAASSAGVVGRHREWALTAGSRMGGTCRVKEGEKKIHRPIG
jgi:hypothetical protein